jgi:hypothetical protein
MCPSLPEAAEFGHESTAAEASFRFYPPIFQRSGTFVPVSVIEYSIAKPEARRKSSEPRGKFRRTFCTPDFTDDRDEDFTTEILPIEDTKEDKVI